MRSHMLAAVILMVIATEAGAQNARIVKGGPASESARDTVVEHIGRLGGLRHCWRLDRKGVARVRLRVDSAGHVTDAQALSKGAVGQCVAGMMRVFDFPTQKAFAAEIDVLVMGDTPQKTIAAGLEKLRPTLNECYERAATKSPKLAGEVMLAFMVKSSGEVDHAAVSKDTMGSSTVTDCLLRVLRGANLGAFSGASSMSMTMPLRFSGHAGKAPDSGAALQPQKDGPVSGDVISRVVRAQFGDFNGCYDTFARKSKAKLAGTVTLRFSIRADGTLRNVKVRESTLGHKAIESCVVEVAKKLKFPAETGRAETKVFYPLSFSSQKLR